jgi:hypothetical protein
VMREEQVKIVNIVNKDGTFNIHFVINVFKNVKLVFNLINVFLVRRGEILILIVKNVYPAIFFLVLLKISRVKNAQIIAIFAITINRLSVKVIAPIFLLYKPRVSKISRN